MKRLVLAALLTLSPSLALAAAPAGGVELVAKPSHSPLVTLALQFGAGAVDDPPGKAGLTQLTARLMAEGGTQALDSAALRAALFPLAASVRTRVDEQQTTFMVTVHKDNVAKAVGILGDVVAHPRFDATEFARLRDAAVNDVAKRLRQGDDENLGKEALSELMFRGHAYERYIGGHVGDLAKLTLDDCKQQAAHLFTRDRLVIGVAGGYTPDVVTRLQMAAAALPASGAARVELGNATPHKPRVRIVEKQTDSTAISIGAPWPLTRHSPDYAALLVARSAFGEHRAMNGRLMQRLRELRGLNYGDYAYIEHFVQEGGNAATAETGRARTQGEFTIWLRPVQNENALFALRGALYELGRTLGDEPFSDDEVTRTKAFLDGYVLLWAQTDARKLGYALDDRALGGGKSTLDTLRAEIAKVTTADVNRVWRAHVGPLAPQLEIVMVGPKAAELKRAIVSGAATPIHYQKDAQGNVPPKPPEIVAADKKIEVFPFGVTGDADVDIVPVGKLFQ